jgi:transcriptional regulator with XRE-family HTH domain
MYDMATGERIHFFRNLRGMTQKYLGLMVGFPERSADIRLAQYESETRTPKAEITEKLASVLDVSPKAIDLPDIDSYIGLMHTFFALEDRYGLKIGEIDGELCLRLDKTKVTEYQNMFEMLYSWRQIAAKLEAGEITKEEYDHWRYKYPEFDFSKKDWKKVSVSQDLSDILVEGLKEE